MGKTAARMEENVDMRPMKDGVHSASALCKTSELLFPTVSRLNAKAGAADCEHSQETRCTAAALSFPLGLGDAAVRGNDDLSCKDTEEGSERRVPDIFPSDGEENTERRVRAEGAGVFKSHAAKHAAKCESADASKGSGNIVPAPTHSSEEDEAVAEMDGRQQKKRKMDVDVCDVGEGRHGLSRPGAEALGARVMTEAGTSGAARTAGEDLERLAQSKAHDATGVSFANERSHNRGNKPSPPNRPDDKDGHYVYELGENLTSRYKIMNKLGEGTFGRVIECWDRERKEYCAIKIIRNVRKYRNAAMMELEVLKKLRANDPDDTRHCVRLLHWFEYRNHVCMVFGRLGLSLYDFLLKNHYAPFDVSDVREFAFQLLVAVGYVHDLDLVHTDLKPENILLRALEYFKVPLPNSKHYRRIPKSTEIKLIDFGSAAFVGDRHASVVSTRHYRAPEVILGLGWSHSCDLWSIGCILVELVTGIVLFNTHDNLEHLAMMERILGDIPKALVDAAHESKQTKGFFDNSILNWPIEGQTTAESRKAVRKLSCLRELLTRVAPAKEAEMLELVDLVRKLMSFEASKRISAEEALNHPFFKSKGETDAPRGTAQGVVGE